MRVRISAVWMEDGQPQADRLIMVVSLNRDRSVADEECFGALIENDGRFPFTGTPERSHFVLDYGEYANGELVSRINIVGKRVQIDDLITRSDHFRGNPEIPEYTYKIEYVG